VLRTELSVATCAGARSLRRSCGAGREEQPPGFLLPTTDPSAACAPSRRGSSSLHLETPSPQSKVTAHPLRARLKIAGLGSTVPPGSVNSEVKFHHLVKRKAGFLL
jgi:hypothetical protein